MPSRSGSSLAVNSPGIYWASHPIPPNGPTPSRLSKEDRVATLIPTSRTSRSFSILPSAAIGQARNGPKTTSARSKRQLARNMSRTIPRRSPRHIGRSTHSKSTGSTVLPHLLKVPNSQYLRPQSLLRYSSHLNRLPLGVSKNRPLQPWLARPHSSHQAWLLQVCPWSPLTSMEDRLRS